MIYRLAWLLATGLGSGLFPLFPGTFGSLVAVTAYWFLLPDSNRDIPSLILYLLILLVAIAAGCWSAGVLEKRLGRDNKIIVLDEFAGQWLALMFLPRSWIIALTGFFVFRFFDILKPFAVRRMENLPGGFGVVADDLLAGVYTNLVLWALIWLGLPLL